jgi:hypothetical protein
MLPTLPIASSKIHAKVGRGELDAEEGKLLVGNLEAYCRVLAGSQLQKLAEKKRPRLDSSWSWLNK